MFPSLPERQGIQSILVHRPTPVRHQFDLAVFKLMFLLMGNSRSIRSLQRRPIHYRFGNSVLLSNT